MKHNILYGLIAALLCVSLLTSGVSAASNPFTDVSSSDWYYTDVMTAVETGLVNGKTSSTFCPDGNLIYTLSVTGAFVSDSVTGNNTDAVIFSKDDLVLNGLGTLTLDSR